MRLTGSGLGCSDWPTCEENQLVAPLEYHAMIEFVNRMITGAGVARGHRSPCSARCVRVPDAPRPHVVVARAGGRRHRPDRARRAHRAVRPRRPPFVIGHFLLSIVLVWNAVVLHERAGHDGSPGAPAGAGPHPHARPGAGGGRRGACWSPAPSSPAPGPTAATRTSSACPTTSARSPASTASPPGSSWRSWSGRSSSCAARARPVEVDRRAKMLVGVVVLQGGDRLHPVLHRCAAVARGPARRSAASSSGSRPCASTSGSWPARSRSRPARLKGDASLVPIRPHPCGARRWCRALGGGGRGAGHRHHPRARRARGSSSSGTTPSTS